MFIEIGSKEWRLAEAIERQSLNTKIKNHCVPEKQPAMSWSKIDVIKRMYQDWAQQDRPFMRSFKTFKDLYNFLNSDKYKKVVCQCQYCYEFLNPPV